jgi:hypothetical protein
MRRGRIQCLIDRGLKRDCVLGLGTRLSADLGLEFLADQN